MKIIWLFCYTLFKFLLFKSARRDHEEKTAKAAKSYYLLFTIYYLPNKLKNFEYRGFILVSKGIYSEMKSIALFFENIF